MFNKKEWEKFDRPLGDDMNRIEEGLYTHVSSRNNPHQVTHTQVGAAAASHTHNASDINAGTLGLDRIPNINGERITSGTIPLARIPSLPADRVTSGTFNADRIPNLPASRITSGAFELARIPNIPASRTNEGVFAAARLQTSGTWTPTLTVGNATINGTYTNRNARWIRIGNIIHFEGSMQIAYTAAQRTAAINASTDGTNARIGGLPIVPVISGLNIHPPVVISVISGTANNNFGEGNTSGDNNLAITGQAVQGQTFIDIRRWAASNAQITGTAPNAARASLSGTTVLNPSAPAGIWFRFSGSYVI